MICETARTTTFAKLHEKCYACSMRIRIIDSPNGNVYVFVEVLISCLSLAVGYRTESDYADLYEQATAHYAFNPDEVNSKLFTNHPDGKSQLILLSIYTDINYKYTYQFFSFDQRHIHCPSKSSANRVDNVYHKSACTPKNASGNTDTTVT